jgi:type VI protein secretion system component VasK
MKALDYIPCVLAGAAGAWLGAISCFFVATSDAVWVLGTVAFSIACAFAGMAIAKVTGAPIGRKAALLVPLGVGLFLGIAMILWCALQNLRDPL